MTKAIGKAELQKQDLQERNAGVPPLRSAPVGMTAEEGEGKLERLQKILAAAGIASRRKAEEIILAGRVQVNGTTIVELGTKHDASRDHIRVDGKLLKGPASLCRLFPAHIFDLERSAAGAPRHAKQVLAQVLGRAFSWPHPNFHVGTR